MINQEGNSIPMPCRRHGFIPIRQLPGIIRLGRRRPSLLLIEIHEQQYLILHRRKEIVFLDEIKDFWSPQAEQVRQRLARLMLDDVSADRQQKGHIARPGDLQLGQALHQNRRRLDCLQLALHGDDHGLYVIDIRRPLLDCL